MKFGQICPAPRRNASIYKCFEFLREQDARKFVKKFAEQPHDEPQVMHTYNELVLGAYMASRGIPVRTGTNVDAKTPDWCVMNPDVTAIVEVINFHTAKDVEDDIEKQLKEKITATWWMGPNTDRLYQKLQQKATGYKKIAENRKISHLVGLFSGIMVDIESQEIEECLNDKDAGLFGLYPSLSGVVFYIERAGVYYFSYYANPGVTCPFDFPEGAFDI